METCVKCTSSIRHLEWSVHVVLSGTTNITEYLSILEMLFHFMCPCPDAGATPNYNSHA